MNETTDFDIFYREKIVPLLPSIKLAANETRSWGASLFVFVVLLIVYFFWLHSGRPPAEAALYIGVFLGFMLVLSLYQYAQNRDIVIDAHKTLIVRLLYSIWHPVLLTSLKKWYRPKHFKMSRLYRYSYDTYEGDDFMEGIIDGVHFQCSELRVRCKNPANSGDLAVFEGLFFVAALNSSFTGSTYISPRKQHKNEITLHHYYKLSPVADAAKINTGDGQFDAFFHIISNAPEEAAAILNQQRRTCILEMCKAMQIPLSFSFTGGYCYIGIPVEESLLEAAISSAGDKDDIRKNYVTIGLISRLVKQLSLANLR